MRKVLQAAAAVGASAAVIVGAYLAGVALAPEPVGARSGQNLPPTAVRTPTPDVDQAPQTADVPSDTTFERPPQRQAQDGPSRPDRREAEPTAAPSPQPSQQRTPTRLPTAERETETAQPAPTQAPAETASSQPAEPEPDPEVSQPEDEETDPAPTTAAPPEGGETPAAPPG